MHPHAPRNPSTAILIRRIHILFGYLPMALAGEGEAIHQLRVWGRRLRVALSVLAAKPKQKRARKAQRMLRSLAQAAGRARDLDVIHEILMVRLVQAPRAASLGKRLVRRLNTARRQSRARMTETILDIDIARLRRGLRATVLAHGAESGLALARIQALSAAWAEELMQGLGALKTRYHAEALHAVRRQTRRLRYLAEIASELLSQPATCAGLLKGLQERLGAIRDRHLLVEWLQVQADRSAGRGQDDLARQARSLARAASGEVRQDYARLMAEWPAAQVEEAVAWFDDRRPPTGAVDRTKLSSRTARAKGGR
ncbi:MAG: CHAD domain-containing protein [Vicinamibacteria bacterium]|jgi:CHAD domain-containing protein|nr:CHAD domain-containing protein [Vicinamibacteria bacterium]